MSIEQLDATYTQVIYKDLIGGRIINKEELLEGTIQPSPKFRYLMNNLDDFKNLFILLGFDLQTVNDTAFFIKLRNSTDQYNEVAANIQTLLTVLSMGLFRLGISPNILADPKGGVSVRDVDAIGEIDDCGRVIKACGLQLPLTRNINSILVDRGILHKTPQERYIFTNAGKYFMDQITHDDEISTFFS